MLKTNCQVCLKGPKLYKLPTREKHLFYKLIRISMQLSANVTELNSIFTSNLK